MATQTRTLPHIRLITPVIPLVIWFGYFSLVYGLVAVDCAFQVEQEWFGMDAIGLLNLLATIAAIALIGVVAGLAFRRWRLAREVLARGVEEQAAEADRLRFLALVTLLLGILSLVATFWIGGAMLVVPQCT
jgi:hypothetical protein